MDNVADNIIARAVAKADSDPENAALYFSVAGAEVFNANGVSDIPTVGAVHALDKAMRRHKLGADRMRAIKHRIASRLL